MAAVGIVFHRVMNSDRKSAEGVTRYLKDTFGCLRLPLTPDSRKRYLLLLICVHLLKSRTRVKGLNKIQTFYSSTGVNINP